jgi:sterol 3beta-glucosyltransferase
MKILIITVGSRGDVQPYIALGKGLIAAGHGVTMCTCASFEPFVTGHGLNYGYMNDEFISFMESNTGREVMEKGGSFLSLIASLPAIIKRSKALTLAICKDAWAVAQGLRPDLIIYHPKALSGAHIAEKLGVRAIIATPLPALVPTAQMPAIGMPNLKLGRWYNKLSYALINKGYHTYDTVITEFRQKTLGLGALPKNNSLIHTSDGAPLTVLHAYSALVSPRPSDWHTEAHVTGYWFLDHDTAWQPPDALQAFLSAGTAPVYVGFGSMAGRNPQRTANLVITALQKAGVRGILATGWGGLTAKDTPNNIFVLDQAPHHWLFARMSAVVHHGGAGTTAAGLRAGCPTIVCPFIADQPYWGKRVHQLGVGCQPIAQKQLTAENLAQAIYTVTHNPDIRQNAAVLGAKLRAEDGVARTIEIVEG